MKKIDPNRPVAYMGTIIVAILSIVQAGKRILPMAAGIAVYVLAAALLTLTCVCLYKDLRSGIVGRILSEVKKNPLGERFFADYTFRTLMTTAPSFLINVIYTIYNGALGILNQSVWFITMAVYYSLLGLMRYRAVSAGRKISRMEDREMIRKKELSVIKTDGILLLALNFALTGVILLTIAQDTARRYSEVVVISIATYTFYKIIMAVVNMVKVRKTRSPVLITIRNIGTADALVSMLTLQATMLASFQGKGGLDANRMNAITGMVVCVLILALGVSMIHYAFKNQQDH